MSNVIGTGYGVEIPKGGGVYLRLKEKDEKVRLRLVSDPLHFHDVIPGKGDDGGDKIVTKVAWIAIHKFMESGKPQKRVVCFQGGPQIYGHVKDLAEHESWGDPKLYDIEVTRTEEKGKYYTVTALPMPVGPLSAEERQLVTDANLDLQKLCLKDIPQTEKPATVAEIEDVFAEE